jgi:hypothetical protein
MPSKLKTIILKIELTHYAPMSEKDLINYIRSAIKGAHRDPGTSYHRGAAYLTESVINIEKIKIKKGQEVKKLIALID